MGQVTYTDPNRARQPVVVTGAERAGRFVIVCEHASNWLPAKLGSLGLSQDDLQRHIAWDPGALPVARQLAEALDAPLVESRISRLAIDCNRPVDAPDLVPSISETTAIPGNQGLSEAERAQRIALSHAPFHAALEALFDARAEAGRPTALITIHSFTPVYKGVQRPWHAGVIHDEDDRLALPILRGLEAAGGLVVAANEPYSPADRVYYTLERHARPRELPCAMIEIRNDEIAGVEGQTVWARRLATILSGIQEPDLARGLETTRNAKGRRHA